MHVAIICRSSAKVDMNPRDELGREGLWAATFDDSRAQAISVEKRAQQDASGNTTGKSARDGGVGLQT